MKHEARQKRTHTYTDKPERQDREARQRKQQSETKPTTRATKNTAAPRLAATAIPGSLHKVPGTWHMVRAEHQVPDTWYMGIERPRRGHAQQPVRCRVCSSVPMPGYQVNTMIPCTGTAVLVHSGGGAAVALNTRYRCMTGRLACCSYILL